MTLGAVVGAELGVAADAHRLAFVADEPLSPEVLPTVETVWAVGHRHSEGDSELQLMKQGEREKVMMKTALIHGGKSDLSELFGL